jgi:hypothetical protein
LENEIVKKFLFQKLLKHVAKKGAYQILMGRLKARGKPKSGRFLRHDVDAILKDSWQSAEIMLPEAHLNNIPTLGNRQMVFLAVYTIAAYHALIKSDVERDYATELFADIGWKIYSKFIALPKLIAKIITRDPQKQVKIILKMFMIFPFSTPGYPGYECKAWSEPNRYCTYWTHCPPFEFVRRYVEVHGDHGEIEAFKKSWCWYDWSLAYAIVDGGYKVHGHYERLHTLSEGDDICDMEWTAQIPHKDYNIKIKQTTKSIN